MCVWRTQLAGKRLSSFIGGIGEAGLRVSHYSAPTFSLLSLSYKEPIPPPRHLWPLLTHYQHRAVRVANHRIGNTSYEGAPYPTPSSASNHYQASPQFLP
jgi:hypothetical protein